MNHFGRSNCRIQRDKTSTLLNGASHPATFKYYLMLIASALLKYQRFIDSYIAKYEKYMFYNNSCGAL